MNSELLAREKQLTAGLEHPVKDPLTGSWRERVTGYSPRPGGVRIPSAEDGNGGGQLGVDNSKPLPYTVTVGVPGNGGHTVQIDPNLITQAEYDAIRQTATSTAALYEALGQLTSVRQRALSTPQQPAFVRQGAQQPSKSVFTTKPVASAPLTAWAKEGPAQQVKAPVAQPAAAQQVPAYVPDGGPSGQFDGKVAELSAVELIDAQMKELAQTRELVIREEQERLNQLGREQTAAPVPGGEPTVAAQFAYPDGSVATANYHAASFECDEKYLVLVYDTNAGGKPYFLSNCGTEARVSVNLRAPSGALASVEVLSVGVEFPVGSSVISVLPVVRRTDGGTTK